MASPSPFTPRLDILPPAQRLVWDELASIPEGFVLYGGTATALHLGHRQSVDFDFFLRRPFAPSDLLESLTLLAEATVTRQEPNTLSVLLDRGAPVRLSFYAMPSLGQVRPPLVVADNGLCVASLLDLAGTKASVVQQRAEAKDYRDIEALLRIGGIGLPQALAAALAIFGPRFNPLATLKALTYFADGDLPSLPAALQRFLADAAAAVDPERLPDLVEESE